MFSGVAGPGWRGVCPSVRPYEARNLNKMPKGENNKGSRPPLRGTAVGDQLELPGGVPGRVHRFWAKLSVDLGKTRRPRRRLPMESQQNSALKDTAPGPPQIWFRAIGAAGLLFLFFFLRF